MERTQARKGRGALSNAEGRYESYARTAEDDGWGSLDIQPEPLRTTLTVDRSRSVIARNRSPDVPFEQSVNPYRGCEHGCIYCFARPTHAWLGWSPGLDFETRLTYKPDAARLLAEELARPGYRCRHLGFGTNTDVYQPVERRLQITRSLLELLRDTSHPVAIVTKSALVERDIDLLSDMARDDLVRVTISVTTLDKRLGRLMEPRASAPHRRLRVIERLSAAGIPTGVLFAPVIPALNEAELERVLEAVHGAGARDAAYTVLRLPLEIDELFQEWLYEHFPLSADRTMARIRDLRGGKHYRSGFGTRMTGEGLYAKLLHDRFELTCKRLGFQGLPTLRTDRFRPPGPAGAQLELF